MVMNYINDRPNGKKYRGNWKDGQQDGEGEFFHPERNKWKKGLWHEGKRIKWLDEKTDQDAVVE
jgi:hypothetical protein